jgi:predicted XRE-type DNA-binding protein
LTSIQIKNNPAVMNSKVGRNRARKDRRVKTEEIVRSSGNVFADLGFRDAEERMWKAQLAIKISRLMQSKGWTQAQAAERVGLDQPRVSQLMRGGLSGFSADRLFAILNRLGYNVEVRISTKEQSPEKTRTRVMIA